MLKKGVSVILAILMILCVVSADMFSANAQEKTVSEAGDENLITVYFINTQKWESVYCYTWSPELASWPGKKMTYIRDEASNGYGIFSIKIDPMVSGLVFSFGGSEHQTVDITNNITNDMGWYITGEDNGKYTVSTFKYNDEFELNTGGDESITTVQFGRYYQSLVTSTKELDILKNVIFDENNKVVVNGTKYIRKGNHNHYDYFRSEPIEWRIIGQEDGCYCLMSEKVLEIRRFAAWEDFWSTCELRKWLNDGFLNEAFSKEEQGCIELSNVTNIESNYDNRPGGGKAFVKETEDYVYMLEKEEIEGLYNQTERIAYATEYVDLNKSAIRYWLRGPKLWTYGIKRAYYVNPNGSVGSWYPTYSYGVRPVIKVSKNADMSFRDEQGLSLNRFSVYQNNNKSDAKKEKYYAAKDVIVTYNNAEYKTDDDGNVFLPQIVNGNVTFEKKGYIKRELTAKQLKASNSIYLEKKNDDAPVIYAVWIGDTDILHTPYPLRMLEQDQMTIYAEVDWGTSQFGSLSLSQNGKSVSFKNSVLSTVLSDNFDTSEEIKLIATDKAQRSVARNLFFQNGATGTALQNLDGLKLAFADKMKFTIPDNIPLLGGTKIGAGLSTFVPITVAVEKGKVYIAIGMDFYNRSYKNNKEPNNPKKLVGETKTFIDRFKDAKLMDLSDAADKIKNFEKNYKDSLRKPTGDFGIEVDFTVFGFAEGTYDENGNIEFYNSGAILNPSGSIKKDFLFVYPVINAPGYYETGLSVDALAKINMAHNKQAKQFLPNAQVSGNISVFGGIGAGVHPVLYASGGLKGTLSSKWNINLGETDSFILEASLNAYAKAGIMGFEGEHEFKFDCLKTRLIDYPSNDAIAGTGAVAASGIYDTSLYHVQDLSYLEQQENNGSIATVGASNGSTVIKSSIYRESTPELVTFKDGTKLAFWTDASQNNINDICLYYCYYNGSSWTKPQQVYNDGTMDYAPCVLKSNNTVYVAWQNASKRFNNVSELSLDDIAPYIDITVAQWNSDHHFTCATLANSGLDMEPVLCEGSEGVYIAWIHNAEDSWFGDNNKNSIMTALYRNGACTAPEVFKSDLGAIRSLAADCEKELKIAYALDTDCNVNTVEDIRVFENSERVSDFECLQTNPQYIDHQLYLYANSNIVPANAEEYSVGSIPTDRYRLFSGDNGPIAVYTVSDGLYSKLVASYYNTYLHKWGDQVTIADNSSFIGAFAADINAEKLFDVIFNDCCVIGDFGDDKPYGESKLVYLSQDNICDITISEPIYDSRAFCANRPMVFDFVITNNGTVPVDSIEVTTKDAKGETLSSYTIHKTIVPGESIDADAYYVAPDAEAVQNVSIYVAPTSVTDDDFGNNSSVAEFSYENVKVTNLTSALKGNNKGVISADIINYGYKKAGPVKVYLRSSAADGKILKTYNIDSIDSLSLRTVSFEVDAEKTNLYYVTVDYSDTEYSADNNDFILFEKPIDGVLGDVDCDGAVTVADATVIQRYVIKTDTIAFDEKVADVDGDGIVTIVDATFIQRYSTNVKVPYAIGEEIK